MQNVNPQITEADGRCAWDTVEGTYRVVVSKEGYETATSREVTVPPEVTDLHVPLLRPDADGDGVPDTSDACPNEAATTANGCPPPDADGDGVPDTSDACPNAAARTANGCPPPTEAPAVTPPSLPQALDTIGPAVALFRGSIVATKGVVPYRVTCARGERICQGTVKLTAPKQKGIRSTKLGTTTFQAPGGKTAVAKIVLSTKNRKLLARHKRLRVVAEVVARDQAGNATIKRQAFTLKAPRK